jgi:hypothetical protein
MLLLMGIFASLVFTAVRFRELPIGRALHDLLIVRTAEWLARTPPRQIFIILLLVIGASLAWVELAPLLTAADYAPALWFADMSLYLDAVLMTAIALAVVQVRSAARIMIDCLRKVNRGRMARPRAREATTSRQTGLPSANDDDPGFAINLAA